MNYKNYEIKFEPTPGDSRVSIDIISPQGKILISLLGGTLKSDMQDYKNYIDNHIKSEAIKPILQAFTAVNEDLVYKVYVPHCPGCNEDLRPQADMPYCAVCGQKLDWSEKDE